MLPVSIRMEKTVRRDSPVLDRAWRSRTGLASPRDRATDHCCRMALPGASHPRDVTDEQWALIGPFLPKLPRTNRRGRPWKENRNVLNGILRVLRTEAPW